MPSMTLDSKPWWLRIAFFLGCPLLLSLPLGLFQAGFAVHLSPQIAVLYWALAWCITWWTSEGFLRVLHGILRPWNIALVIEIALANVLAVIAYAIYFPGIMIFFAEQATQLPQSYFADRLPTGSLEHLVMLLRSAVSGFIAWVLLRSLYAMYNPDRRTIKDAKAASPHKLSEHETGLSPAHIAVVPASKFRRELESKGVSELDRVIAMQACDHYVNVYLDDGRELLIFSRFSDAIDALSTCDGLRIHRSFWVKREAVNSIERDGAAVTAHLSNGLACPVSIKYQGYFEHLVARA